MEKSLPAKPKRALTKRQFQAEAEQRQYFMFSDYYALLRIFEYLNVQDLLRAARVCRMWRDLAMHPSLWKTVRMKDRCEVTDWDGFAKALKRRGTQHLDMSEMLVAAADSNDISKKLVSVISRVTNLVKLELFRCPADVVDEVIENCPQLEMLSAMSIELYSFLSLRSAGNLKRCQELKLRAINWMSLESGLLPLQTMTQLTHLSVTTVEELYGWGLDILESLTNLETLELGKCSYFGQEFGTRVLPKLHNLKRLRLENGLFSCCTFEILEGVSKLKNLSQLELVNFDVKNGFDKYLANCKNIKRLLIIPIYTSKFAVSNNMVLSGVMELSNNLTYFGWGFVDTGDFIPVLKPIPYLKLIENTEDDSLEEDDQVLPSLTDSPVYTLRLSQLQKILLIALPKTRVEILEIPFDTKW